MNITIPHESWSTPSIAGKKMTAIDEDSRPMFMIHASFPFHLKRKWKLN